jgi:hypothetical protein
LGVTRKLLSASTAGLIDWKSDKERVAASNKKIERQSKKQTKLLKEQVDVLRQQVAQPAPAPQVSAAAPAGPPAGWMVDSADATLLRWWDGSRWTEHTQPRAT